MHKRVLPIFIMLASVALFSCGGQQAATEESTTDTTSAASTNGGSDEESEEGHDVPMESPEEAAASQEGNPDGDIFVTDGLQNAISGETEKVDTAPDKGYEPEIEEEEREAHTSASETLAEVCGFSDDGKYFAFVAVDRGDGYGPGTGYVYVIDVVKNEWATRPAVYNDTTGAGDVDEQTGKLRDQLLKKYGIEYRKNLGYGYNFIGVNPENMVLVDEKRYTLDFKSTEGMIELRVKGYGKDILLQKDKKVPASRGVVRRIRLNRAYVFGDKIAVFVEYDGPVLEGFENSRYYLRKNIVVTGVVPK